MKVAILSESAADDEAIRILASAILGRPTESVTLTGLRVRGWPGVINVLPAVRKQLHYHTDAEGLIVVVDSNKQPIHTASHEQPSGKDVKCRLCRIKEVLSQPLKAVPGRSELKMALALAVPQIEAWYRCGLDPGVTEAAWLQGLQSGEYPYEGRGLKGAVYGARVPSLDRLRERAVQEARRLAQNLSRLEADFPNGFGAFADQLRKW